PSSVISVELVFLTEALEFGFGAVHLIGVRVLVVVAKDPQKRATEAVSELNRRNWAFGVELTFVVHNDIAAPAINDCIYRIQAASTQVGMAPPRTEPDETNF